MTTSIDNRLQWKAIVAIVIGSLIGALARQGLNLACQELFADQSWIAIVVSGGGGIALGAIMGWVSTAGEFRADRRLMLMVGLIAVLGTFAASAAVETSSTQTSTSAGDRILWTAALHIGGAIIAAALALTVVRWFRARRSS